MAFLIRKGSQEVKVLAIARAHKQKFIAAFKTIAPLRVLGLQGSMFCASIALCFAGSTFAYAQSTLEGALARAYQAHPSLNAFRASVRATDEGLPQALSGYRPRVTASADIGAQYTDTDLPTRVGNMGPNYPRGAGVRVDQTVWNGHRTFNRVRSAESGIFAARESLRATEQTILFEAAQAYMNVLRDTAIHNLRINNVEVLDEQLRQVKDRFTVGEVTRTDVAQAEARLAGARSQVSVAQALLKSSLARYRQSVGGEPKKLAPGRSVERFLPKKLESALGSGLSEHPSLNASLHQLDLAEYNVKLAEGELYPTVSLTGSLNQRYDVQGLGDRRSSASVVGSVSVPLYEGGEVTSRVRAAKETVAQRRLEVDVSRDAIRAGIVAAWGQLEASKAQILAAQAQVQASEIALNGVREEAKVGQRTTLDVLNAQQELLDARVTLISAQRDRVVASYQVMQAVGQLSASRLGLKVSTYQPKEHFEQVKDKAWGTQIPDGR
jgi:outer membrane protein